MSVVSDGWRSVSLGEVTRFFGGNGFREDLQGQSSGDYPFIKVSDMELLGNKRHIVEANNWIDEKTIIREAFKAFPNNSIVFAKVGAALLLNRRRILTRDTCIDNNMMAAVPHGMEYSFLFYLLSSIDFADFVQSGAVPSINQGQMSGIQFYLPPKLEQAKIAEVLSTVDRAIEQTEGLIAKQQRIKTGLMQDLLTRGIDKYGNLRSEETHEFKDSPLGRIPVEWDVSTIRSVLTDITYGLTVRPKYVEEGIPLVSGKECREGWIDYELCNKITRHDFNQLRLRSMPKPGHVLITKTGTLGRVARIREADPVSAITQNVALMKPDVDKITSEYLEAILNSEKIQRDIRDGVTVLSIPDLQLGVLESFSFPLPDLCEQGRIAERILTFLTAASVSHDQWKKLDSLKTALMQDLLTGEKRVTPLLKAETH